MCQFEADNFTKIDPNAKPTAIGPPFEGKVKVIAELPPGFQKPTDDAQDIQEPPQPTASTESVKANGIKHIEVKKCNKANSIDLNLDLRANVYEKKKKCTTCEQLVYEGYAHDDKLVCKACFKSGKLPENSKKEDFKEQKDPQSWTEQEDLLLLEGIEMFSNDWEKVANHVLTKSRDECILHYLKLPVVDPEIDLLKAELKSDVENPIMSVVAFLASNVKPNVAASSISEQDTNENVMEVSDEKDKQLEATYQLVHTKIEQFTKRLEEFQEVEAFVNEERCRLDRERFVIREQYQSLRNEVDKIYGKMFQFRQAKIPVLNMSPTN